MRPTRADSLPCSGERQDDAALREEINAPLRVNHAVQVPGQPDASLLLMPAWRVGARIGVKLVTVHKPIR